MELQNLKFLKKRPSLQTPQILFINQLFLLVFATEKAFHFRFSYFILNKMINDFNFPLLEVKSECFLKDFYASSYYYFFYFYSSSFSLKYFKLYSYSSSFNSKSCAIERIFSFFGVNLI